MERVAVLSSGGLDSAVLLADLARENIVHPIYVQAGLHWEAGEQRALRGYLAALTSLPNLQPLTVLEMPVRSLYGTFAWVTSPLCLARLTRDLGAAGLVEVATRKETHATPQGDGRHRRSRGTRRLVGRRVPPEGSPAPGMPPSPMPFRPN